jgi:hypothetical protein
VKHSETHFRPARVSTPGRMGSVEAETKLFQR